MGRIYKILITGTLLVPVVAFTFLATQSALAVQPTLAGRVAKYKAGYKARLTFSQQARLKLRCKAAQGKVASLTGRIKGIETSRDTVYKNILERLDSLQTRLQQKDIDTTDLQVDIANLRLKIDGFKTDLAAYQQTVTDLSAIDCTADPTAFRAALEAARTARQKVADDTKGIHTYLTVNLKQTLSKLRAKVAA